METNGGKHRGYSVYFRMAFQGFLVMVAVVLVQRSTMVRQWINGENIVTNRLWKVSSSEVNQGLLLFSSFEQNPEDRFPWDDYRKYAFTAVGVFVVIMGTILGT